MPKQQYKRINLPGYQGEFYDMGPLPELVGDTRTMVVTSTGAELVGPKPPGQHYHQVGVMQDGKIMPVNSFLYTPQGNTTQ